MEEKTIRTPIGEVKGTVVKSEPSGDAKEVNVNGVIYKKSVGSDFFVIKK